MSTETAASPQKKVSAVIPVYNQKDRLPRAVASLLATGYPALEIVVVDDGSTDGSLEIAERLAAEHPEVRLLRHPDGGNHGAGPTRNLGIREAAGAYVCFLDSDDFVKPHRFATSVPILDEDPTVDGVYEWSITHRGEGGRTDVRALGDFDCANPGDILKTILTEGKHWHTNTILLRKHILIRYGGFSEKLRLAQDLVLWLKLACSANLVKGSENPVSVYCLHHGNISATKAPSIYFVASLHAYMEAYAWAKQHRVVDSKKLLLRNAIIGKGLYSCDGLRKNNLPGLALTVLLKTARCAPAIVGRKNFWSNLLSCLLEISPVWSSGLRRT